MNRNKLPTIAEHFSIYLYFDRYEGCYIEVLMYFHHNT